MIEITWRHDPIDPVVEHQPASADDAASLLNAGNAVFAALGDAGPEGARLVLHVTADDLGMGHTPGVAPKQAPFAALLGCADARVPPELVMSQSANDVFVVRVAGNVLGAECVGSLDYAIAHLPSLRLVAVVGHTGCGAVSAAVDAYLDPAGYLGLSHNLPLRSIVDAIMACVRGADSALRAMHGDDVVRLPGYRAALLDTSVVLNAAVAADAVQRVFASHVSDRLGVRFGVFDLATRLIGLPATAADGSMWAASLVAPPTEEAFPTFAAGVASSLYVASLLTPHP
jgi:carbonic anhydrase